MQPPYEECAKCLATPWCKRFAGKVEVPATPSWCNPKFRLDKALKLTNIPKRFLNANAYTYKKDEDNQDIYTKLRPYLADIVETVEEGKNFLFYGVSPGTGKTYHATMLLNQYVYKSCLTSRMDFENPLALYVVYAELMDELRYNKDKDTTSDWVEQIKNVPFLLLDDVGAGTSSEYTNEQTYLLLNYRYNQGLSTIFTTNIPLPKLVDFVGTRIISRMNSNCEKIAFKGKDRR